MLRHFPHGRTQCPGDDPDGSSRSTVFPARARRTRLVLAALLVGALASTSLTSAVADDKDDLEDQRGQVNSDINQAEAALDESSDELVQASNAYDAAKQKLGSARDNLASTQGELKTAQAYDQTMQSRLDSAQQDLTNARADLESGQKRVRQAREEAQRFLVEQATEGDPRLRALGSLLNGEDPKTFGLKMDYTGAVSEAQSASLENLDASEVMLQVQRDEVKRARDRVAEERRAAARNLEVKKELERQAEEQTQQVKQLVGRRDSARDTAEDAKQADLGRLDSLEGERDRIAGKLRAIAAQERREALREKRKQQQQQEQDNGSNGGNSGGNNGGNNNGGNSGGNNGGSDGGDSGGNDGGSDPPPDTGFSLGYPVGNAYITSPYGMRFHPILHVNKLHDGTDFSAACGTPVLASEDGTVSEAYYNAGYGNRIIISHGYHRGVSVATSYNHMTSFSVGVGQSVSKGEVIGYSGTTGYSTGCHMHFMVYVNGATTDPMNWL